MSDPEEPQQFNQAWGHEDPQEQDKWRQAVLGRNLAAC